ncbi:MAG: endonuclease III [Candidatus Babeliales bacterium]|nr:endonuclease III [Candidatus Babeliales bacterium]
MHKALQARAVRVVKTLQEVTKNMQQPLVNEIIKDFGKDPFLILISCLLSLRSRDTGTLPVSRHLFSNAKTPQEILAIPIPKLEKIIYSVNYYKNKARTLHEVSRIIIKDFNGKVPNTESELLSIKGVGPKTANLVLGLAFDIPAICVDVHVHRLSNLMGLIKTKTVEETEQVLKKLLPKEYWIEWNRLLVIWGQNFKNPAFENSTNPDVSKLYH